MMSAIGGGACPAASGYNASGSSSSKFVDRIFSKLDANNDGSIDKAEFASFVQQAQFGSAADNSIDVDAVFSKLDADNNGSVTKEELSQAASKLHDQLRGQQLSPGAAGFDLTQFINNLYSKADTNGDGNVDSTELDAFIGSLPSSGNASTPSGNASAPSSLADALKQADTDGSGGVSKTEFAAALKQAHGGVEGHHHHHGGHRGKSSSDSTDSTGTDPADQAILNFLKQYQQAEAGSATSEPQGSLSAVA
ncbi:MAG TPA: EF-hand domain-containing protein [Burkholderiales bacterium]|nr:EF-hand domain-containing protein [Burkholderiales bacterium]